MNALEEDVDEVETSVFSAQRTSDSARIYTLKREIAEARRAVLPLREPMRRFATGAVPGIEEGSAPFFRDVLDHLNQAAETVDGLDQLLSTAFDAHLAQISVQQNEDMRKISAGAAIVVVPTLIAGVYGMNFRHMPELDWTYGYPYAIALMAGCGGAALGVVQAVRLALTRARHRRGRHDPAGEEHDQHRAEGDAVGHEPRDRVVGDEAQQPGDRRVGDDERDRRSPPASARRRCRRRARP